MQIAPRIPSFIPAQPSSVSLHPPTALQLGSQLVGMDLQAATDRAQQFGYRVRVEVQDGQPLAVTSDLRDDRINVAVDGNVITSFIGIG